MWGVRGEERVFECLFAVQYGQSQYARVKWDYCFVGCVSLVDTYKGMGGLTFDYCVYLIIMLIPLFLEQNHCEM